MREHNAICERLARAYPDWDDDELFEHARLVNAALMAKIHTVEWTTALLGDSTMQTGMRANWWGFMGERFSRRFGRISKSEEVSGIPGSQTWLHGAPYAMTEEFVAVYRMHPLIPDDYSIRSASDNHSIDELRLPGHLRGPTRTRSSDAVAMTDLIYSFATSTPGRSSCNNFPKGLQHFAKPDGSILDLAATDILRSRERGVPRYNEFRRKFHLTPAERFEDFSDDPAVVEKLRSIYGDPEDVDLMIGLYTETPPKGFAFSDTAFRVFILMASRRLKSDRFFTYDFRPEVYSPEGLAWIADNTMSTVLAPELPGAGPPPRGREERVRAVAHGQARLIARLRWRARRWFWNRLGDLQVRPQPPRHGAGAGRRTDRSPWCPSPRSTAASPFSGRWWRTGSPPTSARPSSVCSPASRRRCTGWCLRSSAASRRWTPTPASRSTSRTPPPTGVASRPRYGRRPGRAGGRGTRPRRARRWRARSPATWPPTADGTFTWDLRVLDDFEYHAGLRPLGSVVTFEAEAGASDGRLKAVRIDCDAGSCTPSDPEWPLAQRLALCAASTHLSVVRHMGWIHLAAGGPLAVVTRNQLPPDHPLRRLLWPHVYATQYSNDLITVDQLVPGGDFDGMFSLTHGGVSSLIDASVDRFDLGVIDPDVDAGAGGCATWPSPPSTTGASSTPSSSPTPVATSSATTTTTRSWPTRPSRHGGPP